MNKKRNAIKTRRILGKFLYFLYLVLHTTAYQFSILVLLAHFMFLGACLFSPYVRWFSFFTSDSNGKSCTWPVLCTYTCLIWEVFL
jgi:hypothetical protein